MLHVPKGLFHPRSGPHHESTTKPQLAVVHVLLAQVMRAKNLPGAGQYNTYKAVGKQPLSNKKTLPAHSFGKSTRDASKKSTSDTCSVKAACMHTRCRAS